MSKDHNAIMVLSWGSMGNYDKCLYCHLISFSDIGHSDDSRGWTKPLRFALQLIECVGKPL